MINIIMLGMVVGLFVLFFSNKIKYNILIGENTKLQISKYFLLEVFMLFVVIIGMCANDYFGDAKAYRTYFEYLNIYHENPWDVSYEFFTHCVMLLMRLFDLNSYGKIRALILFLCWISIIYIYRNYISNLCLVLFFYLASFMFANDGVQLKNFVAVTLLLCALFFLLERKKYYLLKFYLIIFFAILMHFSFFAYLIIPIIFLKNFQKNKVNLPIIGFIIYIFLYMFGTDILAEFIRMLVRFVPFLSKSLKYLDSFNGKRSLVYVVIYFVIYFFVYKCYKSNKNTDSNYKFSYLVYNIWNLMGIFLPLLLFANTLFRLYRNLMIIIFILMANQIMQNKSFTKNRMADTIMAVLIISLFLIQPFLFHQGIDVFVPIYYGKFFWLY